MWVARLATPNIAEGTEATSRMHDSALSLPFSQEDLSTEFFGTQETDDGMGEWIAKLRDTLDGLELDLQGLDLDEIEPGQPSDQVRKVLNDEYIAWLPPLARRQPEQHAEAPQTSGKGHPRVRRRAQYA